MILRAILRSAVIGGAAVAALVPLPQSWVERAYSASVYLEIQNALTARTNQVPVALLDVAAGLLLVYFLWRSDDGRNTIGTSGEAKGPGEAEGRADKSHAAIDESPAHKAQHEAGPMGQQSNWNRTAPELTVNRVTATGQRCAATQGPERR